ncbi:MAG: patatin-like phospholipase family protein [Thiomicrorhabdus sp.]|jgi:NTE family protein|nr:patatin-like phospholipase family protein [Thiomicrorhabdus sp.]
MTLTKQPSQTNQTVSLVLGSGGARGMAHIGIIRWLEAHNYQIKSISGSSIGALIGGIYAAGKLDECEAWFKQLSNTDIIGLTDIAWNRSGFIKGDKLVDAFKAILGNPNIEDLAIPFTAVATDIEHEKEVWLQKGSLLDAMRASTALPMIFTPFHKHGITLVDGGVLNPVPIAPTFGQTHDLIIAVNLGGKPKAVELPAIPEEADLNEDSWLNDASALFDSLVSRVFPEGPELETPLSWDMVDISNKAFDSMQSSIARQQLAAYPPDIIIEIPRDVCGMLEFNKINEMIEFGYNTAEKTLGK